MASVARPLLAIAAAMASAWIVALVEGARASKQWSAALWAVVWGDWAVLVAPATAVGLAVAVGAIVLDPRRTFRLGTTVARLADLHGPSRTRASAAALVAPAALVVWLILAAQSGREAFAHGAPAAAGLAVAAVSIVALALVSASVVAAVPLLARTPAAAIDPLIAVVCGATYAIALLAIGVRLGDASGIGPTPLSILGVLARQELDLSPVVALLGIGLSAVLADRAFGPSWATIAVSAAVIAAAGVTLGREAYALSEAPEVARAIEQTAPLGRIGLSLARRATDRDGDGASALFGGGDCDDSDPRRSPFAVDIPGNGIDEDCSGADLPLPVAPAPPPRPAEPVSAFPPNLNLVLITIDALRIDLGFMGYPRPVSPSLDGLAARSTVFDRAYSMASYTGKSVGPTLIGKYPSECQRDGAHFDTYFPENTFVAERLRDAGFHTMGAASHWYFLPKYGLPQGIDEWDTSAIPRGDADSAVTSEQLTNATMQMLANKPDGRFFLWVHYFDPHAYYAPHPEAPDFRTGQPNGSKALYDGEVWFTDHHIGRLLDFIALQAWGANTAIVVTADHGEAFDEHGMNWHGVDLWEPVVRVPLVVYVPGIAPHRVPQKRSLVDLVPTILDVLGVPQPPAGELSGRSMAPEIASLDAATYEERDVFLDMPAGPQVAQHRAIVHGPSPGVKLMSEGANWFFLFDLSRDPGELDDLGRDKALFAETRAAFDQKLATLHVLDIPPAAYQAR